MSAWNFARFHANFARLAWNLAKFHADIATHCQTLPDHTLTRGERVIHPILTSENTGLEVYYQSNKFQIQLPLLQNIKPVELIFSQSVQLDAMYQVRVE